MKRKLLVLSPRVILFLRLIDLGQMIHCTRFLFVSHLPSFSERFVSSFLCPVRTSLATFGTNYPAIVTNPPCSSRLHRDQPSQHLAPGRRPLRSITHFPFAVFPLPTHAPNKDLRRTPPSWRCRAFCSLAFLVWPSFLLHP